MSHHKKKDKMRELQLKDLILLKKYIVRRSLQISDAAASVYDLIKGVHNSIPDLIGVVGGWRRVPDRAQAGRLFGLDRPDSSLLHPPLEWKMSLSERITTETLARLLNAGSIGERFKRVRSFLLALGLSECSIDCKVMDVCYCEVFAEVPADDGRRIDMKIVWRAREAGENVLVIEAKFEHIITPGQLCSYVASTRRRHGGACCRYLILGLSDDLRRHVNRRTDGDWLFCSWRDLWLRFETGRPCEENNMNLRLFLHALWGRMGRLNPGDSNARL